MHLRLLVLGLVIATAAFCQVTVGNGSAALNSNVPDSFQVDYVTNLNVGDSYIDITNTGANGANLFFGNSGGNSGTTTGTICVNVYAFAPDEEMVACCSCTITPNGIAELSAIHDLQAHVLSTQNTPNTMTIDLLATTDTGSSCASASYGGSAGTSAFKFAPGMLAWRTTLHNNSGVTPNAAALTETQFAITPLWAQEASRLQQLCLFVDAQNSGVGGICNSCTMGALGATKK